MPEPRDERDERLEVLSEALAELVRRQRELEERVRMLESGRTVAAPLRPPPESIVTPPPLPAEILPASTIPPTESVPLETTLGLTWINRIAVFTLLLGAAFLFKYGVDNEWFGPGARVALGVAAAIISLLAGHRLWRRGQTVYAQGIIGLGLSLLYLSIYAAAMLYHLLPQGLAFAAMCGITAGAGGLALLYSSQAVAVIAMLGGYLTPPALSTGEDHPWILFGYVLLVNLAGLLLARKRRWTILEPLASAATILLYAAWFETWFSETNRTVATVFAYAFYVQFSVASLSELWAVFQLGASIALALAWQDHGRFAWWNFALLFSGLAMAPARLRIIAPLWTLCCFWLPFWIWYSPDAPFGVLCLVFALLFDWAFVHPAEHPRGLAMIPANAAVYFAASYGLLNPAYHQYMGLLAAAVGGLHLFLARRLKSGSDAQILALGVTLAFVTLAVPIQFAGFRITMAWALEGAVLAWLCSRYSSDWLRLGCWTLLTMVIARLFFFDIFTYSRSSEYSTLGNTRFLTFAASAVALWLAARFLSAGSLVKARGAAATYVAGHVVLLFGLGLEIGGWVSRNIAIEDQSGVQIIAISVTLTIYAVILIVLGVQTRAAIHRILGLALVALVVAKLYLVDVWVLGRPFRITAFLALGVLLLALSYLYSRWRPALARLWGADAVRGQDDSARGEPDSTGVNPPA